MQKRTLAAIAALAATTALTGCSSPNTANAGNFAGAINAYYSEPGRCVMPRVQQTFSLTKNGFPIRVLPEDAGRNVLIAAMVNAGVLRISGTEKVSNTNLHYDLYSPTPAFEGKVAVGIDPDSRSFGLCAAHRVVRKVTNFKKLGDEMAAWVGGGAESFEVQYSYKNAPAAWARIPSIQKVVQSTGGPDGATVYLDGDVGVNMTHNGWRVIDARR